VETKKRSSPSSRSSARGRLFSVKMGLKAKNRTKAVAFRVRSHVLAAAHPLLAPTWARLRGKDHTTVLHR